MGKLPSSWPPAREEGGLEPQLPPPFLGNPGNHGKNSERLIFGQPSITFCTFPRNMETQTVALCCFTLMRTHLLTYGIDTRHSRHSRHFRHSRYSGHSRQPGYSRHSGHCRHSRRDTLDTADTVDNREYLTTYYIVRHIL